MDFKRDFHVVWFGQTISAFGSQMTTFAMSVWLFEQTKSLVQFGMMVALQILPTVLLSPVAGVIVDRFDRRRLMLFSDMIQVLLLSTALVLLISNMFQIWHLYLLACASAVLLTMQQLAYSTLIPRMVPADHLGKANGMLQITHYSGTLFAPLLGVGLMQWIGLKGVIVIDIFTFVAAVVCLLIVGKRAFGRQPKPEPTAVLGSWKQEMLFGWRYVRADAGLSALMRFMALCCFAVGCVQVLFRPLILTVSSPQTLAIYLTLTGAGGFLGALYVAMTGGPKDRVRGVLLFMMALGIAVMAHSAVVSIVALGIGSFVFAFCFPVIGAGVQSVWQQRVPQDVQGRVFAFRRMVTSSAVPLGVLVSPWVVEYIVAPLVTADGAMSRMLGTDLSVYPGFAIAIPFFAMGVVLIATSAVSLFDTKLASLSHGAPTPSPRSAEAA